jgi:hypothetical protein
MAWVRNNTFNLEAHTPGAMLHHHIDGAGSQMLVTTTRMSFVFFLPI